MCGRLQCNGGDISQGYFTSNLEYCYATVTYGGGSTGTFIVNSVVYDVGYENQDPGLVSNGASCGTDKVRTSGHKTIVFLVLR